MRVKLDTGGLIDQDTNRGIGVYAGQMLRRLPKKVEVVATGQQLTHGLVFKLFSPRPLPVPAVITVHDLIPIKYPQAYPPGIKGRFKWWRNKRQLRLAAGIITDSQASKQDIIKFTGIDQDKIFVVYLAADEIFKPFKAVNKYSLPKKFVLYVGDLNWNKNVVKLAKLCLKLRYPLVVVGRQAMATDYDHNHPETKELIRFLRLAKKHPRKIIRLGVVPAADLAEIYNLARVYVQPSRDEGFGLPVLEAMSCGCPVLSSGKGSLPEITGQAGLKLNQKNIRSVWRDAALRRQLSHAGLRQAKKFSWNKTVKATVRVYEKIIADRVNH